MMKGKIIANINDPSKQSSLEEEGINKADKNIDFVPTSHIVLQITTDFPSLTPDEHVIFAVLSNTSSKLPFFAPVN
jgi:hypothetical protein